MKKQPRRRDRLTIVRRNLPEGTAWEFRQPRCGRERLDDISEVEAMIAAGEVEIAREELIWLLSECPDFLEAHVQLGLLALAGEDLKLARGHFGRAVELCTRVLDAAGSPTPVPYRLSGNRAFHEAAKGLVHCLVAAGRRQAASRVCRQLTAADRADPLGLAKMLEQRP